MPEKTAAQKRAQKNYMEKFSIARVRMEKEHYEAIQAAAAAAGESVNAYINAAITQRMEREATERPSEATTEPLRSGAASFSPGTDGGAMGAAEG